MTFVSRRTTAFTVFAAALVILASAPRAGASWSLVWSDEFDGTSLNTANWTPAIGNGCPSLCGWGNNELQYYRSQNIAVADGHLTITTKRENYGGSQFTSGRLHSQGKQSFLYGRIEMRAKLPTGGGMWPAFWMMPENDVYGGWAASGEIDIMESANGTTTVGGALHYGGEWPDNTSTSTGYTPGYNFADAFHTYAVEWEPDQIRWYVDGVLFSLRNSSSWYSANASGNTQAPFDQEFHILLNTAVGGWYTGCTEPACITSTFPQEYVIDYVRVYEDIVNVEPAVAFTAPLAGQTVPAGLVTITADAADADGSVQTVEFYVDAALVGTDTTAPYSFAWTVSDGCYDLAVRVVDDLGGEANATADVTVGAGCGQAPYGGTAPVLPFRLEAEDFDSGGEGVAYHDFDSSNNGGQYRTAEGVDIQTCTDVGGGYNLGWLSLGEWIEYTVDVPVAGVYSLDARVASLSTGGAFRFAVNGTDRSGDVPVPVTTGWQTWTTVNASLNLEAGLQILRFEPLGGEFNLNWFELAYNGTVDVPGLSSAATLHPAYPNPFNPSTTLVYELAVPGKVTLAVYDMAGRRIRVLESASFREAGRHTVVWDGRDEANRAVPSGVYFARLLAAGVSQSRRLVLQK